MDAACIIVIAALPITRIRATDTAKGLGTKSSSPNLALPSFFFTLPRFLFFFSLLSYNGVRVRVSSLLLNLLVQ